jgi:YesN/AraC family two-component response regulator
MKILIAEDEANIAKGIGAILQTNTPHKHRIVFAENGLEALRLAEAFNPDLVISDIRMLHMNGIEFIENLKGQNPSCKVIIISGYSNFEYAQRALRVGAMDYLLKPIDKERLLELVDKVRGELNNKIASEINSVLTNHEYFNLDFDKEEYPRSLKKIIAFLKKNYMLDVSLQMIGKELMLHPNYISSLVNKHLKVSLNYIINYIRLLKSCELLSTTDMSIAEISYIVGYNNERRIYSAFRKNLNSSPGDFRKTRLH